MSRPTIVFDTNAIISALMYPDSVSSKALVEAIKYFQLVASDRTWNELAEVSSRKKFAKYYSQDSRLHYLTQLAAVSRFCEVKTIVTECKDASDNKFLELAIDANSKVIVSGDADLRSMHKFNDIAIISPSEFLALLTESDAE